MIVRDMVNWFSFIGYKDIADWSADTYSIDLRLLDGSLCVEIYGFDFAKLLAILCQSTRHIVLFG